MLKISFSETTVEERWILAGHLSGVWVSELRTSWKKYHRTNEGRKCIVDLKEVTFIDRAGERLLRVLRDQGAQFISGGCYIRHIVDQLKVRRKRKIPKLLASFLVAFAWLLFDAIGTRGQNAKIARGQRLLALNNLWQVSAGASQTVQQASFMTFGLSGPKTEIPTVFDHAERQEFSAEGMLKPGLSVVPDVRVR